MAPESSKKPAKGGLSLYANLLDPSTSNAATPATISRAPVVFKQNTGDDLQQEGASASKHQLSAASLRFQPTKRPQLSAPKPKAKPSANKANQQLPANVKAPETGVPDASNPTWRPQGKNTLADWAADPGANDEGGYYSIEKRQRGGRKKRKKTKEDSHAAQNWDDIYDPSRPNNYEEYKHSDEKISELREWKDRLYAHRMARRRTSDASSMDEDPRYSVNRESKAGGLSFAPPTSYSENHVSKPITTSDETTAEDAYARRVQLSQSAQAAEGRVSPSVEQTTSADPPAPSTNFPQPIKDRFDTPAAFSSAASTLVSANGPAPTISKAPVRYNLPPAPSELPRSDAELESTLYEDEGETGVNSDQSPRSLRPGQTGFAARLMSKYGWTKGSGLGAKESGIINPLRVQVEKQKKKPDSEGGGYVGPGGKGKIIGGDRKGGETETGKFGAMSEVVILLGMVDGMDLDAELEGAGDGGLMQEIGEECGEKYGRVERVYIDRSVPNKPPVFVKFTSQLSALRAVNALEGRIFNGNTITARFFDVDDFEKGVYTQS
ncbi:hypothetical protein MMC07_009759, partial [Pseudocyphellaria aurata]|nr:hypothetical protein [Pseudocyphellaria aurata]